jgi:hypothetical protein
VTFSYSPDKLDALSRTISPGRLAPYIDAGGGDVETAVRLYELNARLSSAFYTPLQTLEVTVRNAIDDQFRACFGDIWTDLGRIKLQPPQQDDVRKALREVSVDDRGQDVDYTHDDVVAELNFGFWVGVLGPKNDTEIWRKSLWQAFPNRPRGVERKTVQAALNSVRRLRNRIAHHCRIIHRDLVADHATILEVIGWVCTETHDWTAALSSFDPSDIPVPQQALPIAGMPETDPVPPATNLPERDTRNGRPRLGITHG